MSIRLATIDLSAAIVGTTGTLDWQQTTGQSASSRFYGSQTIQGAGNNAAHLFLLNESPCELLVDMATGETFVLPAGGWHDQELQPSTTSLSYTVDDILAGALVFKLYSVWYAPHETPPRVPILGNSPIGGVVGNINAQFLQGLGQLLSLTEIDDSGFPALTPGTGMSVAVYIGGRNELGGYGRTMEVGSSINPPTAFVNVFGLLTTAQLDVTQTAIVYNNEGTAANGLASVVAAANNQLINVTTTQTLINYTAPNDGARHMYRVDAWIDAINGASPNNLAIILNYVDTAGNARATVIPMWSGGLVNMTGGVGIPTGRYEGMGISFAVNPGTTITITFRDPTNTPNDRVSVALLRYI